MEEGGVGGGRRGGGGRSGRREERWRREEWEEGGVGGGRGGGGKVHCWLSSAVCWTDLLTVLLSISLELPSLFSCSAMY